MNGTAEFGIGTQIMIREKLEFVEWTQMIFAACDVLATRIPIRVPEYTNLILPFPSDVWTAFLASLGAMIVTLFGIHRFYLVLSKQKSMATLEGLLVTPVVSKFDYIMYPVAMLTEPVSLPWFKRYSTGKADLELFAAFQLYSGYCRSQARCWQCCGLCRGSFSADSTPVT